MAKGDVEWLPCESRVVHRAIFFDEHGVYHQRGADICTKQQVAERGAKDGNEALHKDVSGDSGVQRWGKARCGCSEMPPNVVNILGKNDVAILMSTVLSAR